MLTNAHLIVSLLLLKGDREAILAKRRMDGSLPDTKQRTQEAKEEAKKPFKRPLIFPLGKKSREASTFETKDFFTLAREFRL